MSQDYWSPTHRPSTFCLERFAITESDYLSALREVTALFPYDSSREYYKATCARLGCLNHFNLTPHPNQRLPYNPVPILLHLDGQVAQLLYLGLALRDTKQGLGGQTKAFSDLASANVQNYRGALFELEVGAVLVRSGLRPVYRTTTPDFVMNELPLGVEASVRDVPLFRAVTEGLMHTLGSLEFGHLFIELAIKGEHDSDDLVHEIRKDVQSLLYTRETELIRPLYRIGHDLNSSEQRTVEIGFGDYRYRETLAHLLKTRLTEKEEQIRNGLGKGPQLRCVAALDTRSLLAPILEPESEYERQLVERNQTYFDGLRTFREEVVRSCQIFVAQSALIKGVLLWEGKRLKSCADEVHRRYSVCLVTAERNIEVDTHNLAGELANIAQRNRH